MPESTSRFYDLLPAVHRARDSEQGYPLLALLQLIEEHAELLEEDIEQLYENWFIETAQDWVVPYIGDLVGYRQVHEAGAPGDPESCGGTALSRALIPRRDVANTINHRRRKGTLALLEDLAFDVARWPARAVEFNRLLVATESLNALHLDRGRTADLRDGDALELLNSPFDRLAHVVEVRRPSAYEYGQGRYNLPNVGLFVWRMKSYSVSGTSAYSLEEVGPHNFTFSILGNDSPLYAAPVPEAGTGIAEEHNLPVPIRRRVLEADLATGAPRLYGSETSIHIEVGKDRTPLPPDVLLVADLTDWSYVAQADTVAIDPELGRLSFPPQRAPKDGVWVHYRYGFSADIGGGEYRRTVSQPAGAVVYGVGEGEESVTVADAMVLWREQKPKDAVIEIRDSGFYADPIEVELAREQTLQIRAASETRPVIRLLDRQPGRPDSLRVQGEAGSRFTIDGLMISGRPVRAEGALAMLRIRHCTLVPGWDLRDDCEPTSPAEPSIELVDTYACLVVEHSIVGSIQVSNDEVEADPTPIRICDSIVDATDEENEAIGGVGWPSAHVVAKIRRSTVIGLVQVHTLELAENSIFLGSVCVARSQIGCVRFSYIDGVLPAPRRYRCQPELVMEAVVGNDEIHNRLRERERRRVRPLFDSMRYGRPEYCRLSLATAEEIRRGADDLSEMGVFHDLFNPQRRINLDARLQEHTPAPFDVGILFADAARGPT